MSTRRSKAWSTPAVMRSAVAIIAVTEKRQTVWPNARASSAVPSRRVTSTHHRSATTPPVHTETESTCTKSRAMLLRLPSAVA